MSLPPPRRLTPPGVLDLTTYAWTRHRSMVVFNETSVCSGVPGHPTRSDGARPGAVRGIAEMSEPSKGSTGSPELFVEEALEGALQATPSALPASATASGAGTTAPETGQTSSTGRRTSGSRNAH